MKDEDPLLIIFIFMCMTLVSLWFLIFFIVACDGSTWV